MADRCLSGVDGDSDDQAISITSFRMFEVKGALMVTGTYDDPMMKLDLFLKDIKNITAFANALHCPTPLLAAATQFFTAAHARGRAKQDTASVCTVLEEMAGLKRKMTGEKIEAGSAEKSI
ncbi:MAG: NAD-binding protein [Syntrophales bacterium]|nr:NAD-binding protein [Syntrophales bacterium]